MIALKLFISGLEINYEPRNVGRLRYQAQLLQLLLDDLEASFSYVHAEFQLRELVSHESRAVLVVPDCRAVALGPDGLLRSPSLDFGRGQHVGVDIRRKIVALEH